MSQPTQPAPPPPADLIPMADAIELVGHSRSWFENRVKIYRVGRFDKVSKSEVLTAKAEYDTPKLRAGGDEK